ncbi:hypothetical protein A3C96_00085 [Candidatus Uhrbacteria bacterium RIFCSPHIGHO2_02_FULL_60_10]|uniref:Uncharacterized protein n=1 Tax=Candidatus Uhrbacteria bacterium RIFCSPHIGHO2_02_FULL_60_10 TaxID=1802392 RepID=A0A1F7U9T7_9BACT|nr:MAG: hypothetical protein A3C96_00085 [Candidatus Uhrbacteria bacterium RIFCSPHIGHO2_02_FULL_60_10]
MPQLTTKPTLAEWQAYVKEMIDERHFTKDPNEVFVLFAEEVGELAKELRKKWKYGAGTADSAAGELADVFMYLADLANHFGVDLETALRAKLAANEKRTWEF